MDIAEHEAWFFDYARRERALETGDVTPIDLKIRHSREVLATARAIAAESDMPPAQRRACLLAALYHDVARFEQYRRYRTFRDRESCNHGLEGVRILKREGRLDGEPAALRRRVLAGVGLHNRFALPERLPEEIAEVTHVVRDADKLDILRIMHENLCGPEPYHPTVVLGLPDDPDLVSGAVLRAAREGRVASYADLSSVNDLRVLLGTWLFDMHFPASRRQFAGAGHARELLESLPQDENYGDIRKALLDRLAQTGCGEAPGEASRDS
ncbi:HD domain-containing protein [Desulfovibrio sp.]|uniref:HD domain-containing protein n=1 Tax=Desulfovibrio sp. TaxID=885 RepID=UPI0023CEB496|nr:HD domain-containing protein [Desulfovibrio sp.]MDE7240816.1 HD domain-containing protein [Desulfovibrio sp.]